MDTKQLISHNSKTLPDPHLTLRTGHIRSKDLLFFGRNRLRRMFFLREVLEVGITVTAESVSKVFGVSLRTAYRDLSEIKAAGIPISRNKTSYTIDPKRSIAWSIAVSEAWTKRMSDQSHDGKANNSTG